MLVAMTETRFALSPVRLSSGPDDVFYKKSVYTITSRSTHTDELGSILLKISERKNMLLSDDSPGSSTSLISSNLAQKV